MLGNDIVDFGVVRSEGKHNQKRWSDKLFARQEQAYIDASADAFYTCWVLWSMKEAAYKANQRLVNHPPKFNPKRNLCSINNVPQEWDLSNFMEPISINGFVTINEHNFTTHTVVKPTYIHTMACLESAAFDPVSKVTEYGNSQKLFNEYLSDQCCPNPEDYSIKKDENGIPYVYLKNKRTTILTSFSHHGQFGAYVVYKE